ncbi:MAG: ABC transporter permease, partial [Propionibacteriaceae bacterium]|nr:ABC transporter permease [Propionibacteriaceae bacterium]
MRFFSVVVKDIRATALRSLLTCLSMLVGVLAVVGVSAAGAITEEVFIAQTEQTSGRIATYRFDFPLTGDVDAALEVYQELSSRIGPQPVGMVVTAQQGGTVADQYGVAQGALVLNWTEGDLGGVRRLPLVAGAIPASQQLYPPWVALNQASADDFGFEVGDTMLLAPREGDRPVAFRVAAIIAD